MSSIYSKSVASSIDHPKYELSFPPFMQIILSFENGVLN
jgi:hypothetical protein